MLACARHRLAGEALLDPVDDGIERAGVHPRDQPEGEEVLGALGVAGLGAGVLGCLLGQRGHRHLVHGEGRRASRPRAG